VIDHDKLEPHITGPHSPDAARPISEMKQAVKDNGWEQNLSAALIGSCTNSSYEDIGRATHVVKTSSRCWRQDASTVFGVTGLIANQKDN
jgi:aconitate hydratase